MPKKPVPKKTQSKSKKPDVQAFYDILQQIRSELSAIADMVANLGPKQESEPQEDSPDTPDEAA